MDDSVLRLSHAIFREAVKSSERVDLLGNAETTNYKLPVPPNATSYGEDVVSRFDSSSNVRYASAQGRRPPEDWVIQNLAMAGIGAGVHRVDVSLHDLPSQYALVCVAA